VAPADAPESEAPAAAPGTEAQADAPAKEEPSVPTSEAHNSALAQHRQDDTALQSRSILAMTKITKADRQLNRRMRRCPRQTLHTRQTLHKAKAGGDKEGKSAMPTTTTQVEPPDGFTISNKRQPLPQP